ncbi:MAG: DUF2851 family protein [Chthoniobacteraceae bacterium]|nr:DUF2851 family protein [Chthoniobacteraceae bacterium]
MRLADRYAQWLEGSFVAEAPLPRVARELPDGELQALWFAGEFGREFMTTTGGPVRVERFGAWNAGPGPQFAGAQIVFGDARVRGGVAVHWNAAEWDREAAASPDYEGTILHVFAREVTRERGAAVPASCTALGREVPQVWLDTTRYAYLPAPQRPDCPAVCRETFAALPEPRVLELVEAAAQYRLCRKAARLERWGAEFGKDEALYQAVAEALGYRANKLPMLLLAQRFPLALLRAQRAEIEPLLFAGSGFLNATDLHPLPGDTRGYLRELWTQWWPRRTEYERLTVPRALWNPRGVRPVNHPQRRVAALAGIVRHWPVLEALALSANITGLDNFFGQLAHPYWDRHYTLTSRRSAARMALVGGTRAADLLVNVFFPSALAAAPDFWESYRSLPAPDSNRRVENAARRLFGAGPLARRLSGMAMTQQGLLQLDEDFCAACEGDCARCALPERLDRWGDVAGYGE